MKNKNKKIEIWKDIPGYEGFYKASNLGNIKSLDRMIRGKSNSFRLLLGKKLKGSIRKEGYLTVALYKDKIRTPFDIHKLIAITFLNHTPCGYELVVDHKNENKLDNRESNLQIITQRKNITKGIKKNNTSSKYTGVCWNNKNKNWFSTISHKGKQLYLGSFQNEKDASYAYQEAILSISKNEGIKLKRKGLAKGYYFCNTTKKYKAQICVNGKMKGLGYFKTEDEAKYSYQSFIESPETHKYKHILNR